MSITQELNRSITVSEVPIATRKTIDRLSRDVAFEHVTILDEQSTGVRLNGIYHHTTEMEFEEAKTRYPLIVTERLDQNENKMDAVLVTDAYALLSPTKKAAVCLGVIKNALDNTNSSSILVYGNREDDVKDVQSTLDSLLNPSSAVNGMLISLT